MNPLSICALLSIALAGLTGCDKIQKDPVAPKVQQGSAVTPSTSSVPDPSVPSAAVVLTSPVAATAKDEGNARPNAGMTKSQESSAMPMAGQVNNHSSTALDPGKRASAP